MRRYRLSFMVLTALLVVLVACGKAVVSPITTPLVTPATVTPQAPISTLAAISPEETAWTKVVESAKKEGNVTAMSVQWLGEVGLDISRAFKERYGINLETLTGRGVEQVERLKTERRVGQHTVDVLDQGSRTLEAVKQEGLMISVADELPALRDKGVWLIEPTALDPNGKMYLVQRFTNMSPFISTTLVKTEDIPRSYKDLLDPKWKGKMSFSNPSLSVVPYEFMVVLMESKAWDEEYIKALYKQSLRFDLNSTEGTRGLVRGEMALYITGADTAASSFAREGAPIQAIDMKEGVVQSPSGQGVIANSPHPNAARVFLNWLYSKEGMTIVSKAMTNKMGRKDVPDFRSKLVQITPERPLLTTIGNLQKANTLFEQKWFDKLVGR